MSIINLSFFWYVMFDPENRTNINFFLFFFIYRANIVNQAQKQCYYLTFFTANNILAFHDYFTSETLDKENDETCKTLSRFVNGNAQLPCHGSIKISRESPRLEVPCKIGNELVNIYKNLSKPTRTDKSI